MINFLSHKLEPVVHSDVVDDDNHPVQNLIAKNPQKLDQGFMAYSVTKPPVELTFSLFCPITIHRIKLWPRLGALRTTSVDIFGKNQNGKYEKIGTGESDTADVFEFVNVRREIPISDDLSYSSMIFTLFPTMGHLLTDCAEIKITIRKTARCVPVIRKVEIWGLPSKHCQETVKSAAKEMWKRSHIIKPCVIPVWKPVPDNTSEEITDTPDEFLDELTYEIMTFPMILPSGKIIDQRTIERHNVEEEKWGRQPSDPFTSLTYTDSRKPIFNAALKSRIDQYLLKHANSNRYQHIPRTVGTANPYQPLRQSLSRKRKRSPDEVPMLNLSCSSLEAEIRKALSTTTRYTLTSEEQKVELYESDDSSCHSCRKSLGRFYKIESCQHLICRECLEDDQLFVDQSGKALRMASCSCGVRFKRQAVQRYHCGQ
ncbi:RING finger protein 37 [Uranotaenia lowii]|uniref:RING finger protein 37 n=1 Tax=Uranotaenia lowii TaxID=190385 RepID=UPI002478FBB2|nr:RING finger protein 37 [Uranotaenia lowii]